MAYQALSPLNSSLRDINVSCSLRISSPNYNVLPLTVLVVFGAIGNLLVCMSIVVERRLQTATNYFLFSLALADLMVSVFVMPASIAVEYNRGFWLHGYELCVVHTALDVLLCSTSIVHMAVISLDRYRGISRPFRARNTSHTEVAIKIVIIWIATAVLSSPICVIAFLRPEAIWTQCQCGIFPNFKLAEFQIYGTITTFLLPSSIMVVTYLKTVRLLRAQMQLTLGSEPVLRRTAGSATASYREPTYIIEKADMLQRTSSGRGYFAPPGMQSVQVVNRIYSAIMTRKRKKNPITRKMGRPSMKKNMKKAATAYYLMSRKDSRALVKKEKKATTVLGIVFGSFFLCWAPFFITNMVLALCGHHCSRFPPMLAGVFLWLGYTSSMINPVIYTTFNGLYRITFINILRCGCIWSRLFNHRQTSGHRSDRRSVNFQLKDYRFNSSFLTTRGKVDFERDV